MLQLGGLLAHFGANHIGVESQIQARLGNAGRFSPMEMLVSQMGFYKYPQVLFFPGVITRMRC